MDTKIQNVEEAKKVIGQIISHQKTSSEKHSQIQKQISDLTDAHRALVESQTATKEVAVYGGDEKLRTFTDGDRIQWKTEKKTQHLPGLGRVEVSKPGLLDSTEPCNQWHQDLIRLSQERALLKMCIMSGSTPKADTRLFSHLQKAPNFLASTIERSFKDDTGVGGEWIPDQFRPDLFKPFTTPRVVAGLFDTIPMDKKTMLAPVMNRGGRPYLRLPSTDTPYVDTYGASTVSTSQRTITAASFCTLYNIDSDAAEDTVFPLLDVLSNQISSDLVSAYEDCCINGGGPAVDDLSTFNIRSRWGSSGLGTSTDHRRGFTGLRDQAFDRSSTKDYSGAAFTYATLMDGVAELGELNGDDRVILINPELLTKNMLSLDQVVTFDKMGDRATILTGQLAAISGIPIVVTRFLSARLAADGGYDNSDFSKTGFLIVSRNSYKNFERKGITVESDKVVASGTIQLASTYRSTLDTLDFSTTKNVIYGFNLPS